jgi:hypothetical protein
MPRPWITTALLFVVAAVATGGMTHSDPPGEKLQRAKGARYELTITRFSEGEGLTCPPFRLGARFDSQADLEFQLLSSEQSDDITLAQTHSNIYIFYNELALDGFASFRYDSRDAKLVLCDINVPICANEMKRLAKEGVQMRRVCGRVPR